MLMDVSALTRLGAEIRIAELIAEIESLVDAFPGLGKVPIRIAKPLESKQSAPRTRRKMAAATQAKLKAAWARRRGETETAAQQTAGDSLTDVPEKKRRTISAAGKARIAAVQRRRWAAIRKARKKG
jgi:hypothetical protein